MKFSKQQLQRNERYLKGELTPGEAERFEAELAENEKTSEEFGLQSDLVSFFSSCHQIGQKEELARLWESLPSHPNEPASGPASSPQAEKKCKPKRRRMTNREGVRALLLYLAAILLLLAIACLFGGR